MTNTSMRIQVTTYNELVMEVIVEQHMVDTTLNSWRKLKDAKLIQTGGTVIQRADLPRLWTK